MSLWIRRSSRLLLTTGAIGLVLVAAIWPFYQVSQQQLAIARALLTSPRLLLMDEPFGALDHQTRELMQELLQDIWQSERKTVLFVTHDIDEAIFMGNRVMVMSARPGRIKCDLPIELPYPRHYSVKTSPAFSELKARLTEEIRIEVRRASGLS